ncbi:hypothetical protein GCM10009547_10760 [Sporichthya brevicatena]|uniref:non-specific serine/threonine protein kinase n=1 Tax=Sporichthya brevicatena TaxID=171442 RepID=A0ABN1GFP0_9ACTN
MDDPAAAETPLPTGYSLVRPLGSGRAGRALLCRDGAGREVVLRLLAPPPDHPNVIAELTALAAAADHPCAVRLHRAWIDPEAGLCLEQQYCAGGVLAAPVPQADALAGTLRVAAALAHLHSHGVLHLDVRPATVLLDDAGRWCLADAGVAAALGLGPAPDTPAPRELQGWEAPGPAADVFGLGVVLHTALAGAPPAGASDPDVAALPASTPAILTALLTRMVAPDPADRPGLNEVDQVLRSLIPPDRVPAVPALTATPPPGPVPTPRVRGLTEPPTADPAQRRGLLVAAAAAVLFFAGAAGVVATHGTGNEDRAQLAGSATQVAPVATPTLTPSTSPVATPTATAKPIATPEPRKPRRPKPRGTTAEASGALVDQGFVPYRISVFEYRNRIGVLLHMARISAGLKEIRLYSVRPNGSDRRIGDDEFTGPTPSSDPRSIAFFFGPDVPLDRCVSIVPVLTDGRKIPDPRIVCVQPLSDQERVFADDAWVKYLDQTRTTGATPRPTRTPSRST